LSFVQEYFPDFHEIYLKFPKNIMRADVIRYLIMYQIGGLYVDLDYEMIKTFDMLDFALVLPYNRNISFGDAYDGLGNCILASSPGHVFWKFVITDLVKSRDYANHFKSLLDKPYITKNTTLVEAVTGPEFLTRIFFDCKSELENYSTPKRTVFHPIQPESKLGYLKLLREKTSYGIHHCAGSWRDKFTLKKIYHKLKNEFLFT
jgi:mannosyltransferase OCH1-like enzyme